MEIFDDWLKTLLTALLHSQVHTKQYYIYVYVQAPNSESWDIAEEENGENL
jgi:phenylpyruvate tautomerase PptA (4-oxalocrotonate tautomerase family)